MKMTSLIKENFEKIKFNSHKKHNPECDIIEGHLNQDSFMTYGIYVKGEKQGEEFMEYYAGPNYVVGSTVKSFSRLFKTDKIPSKYKSKWEELKKVYNSKYKGK